MSKSGLLLCFLLLAVPTFPAEAASGSSVEFPESASLSSAVAFWKRVYLDVSTDGGFIHDARNLGVIYETLSFNGERSQRRRERKVKARKKHWKAVLARLATGAAPRDGSERAIIQQFTNELGRVPKASDYRTARTRLRFQLGQSNKFREGVIKSGAYEAAMRRVFREAGLPEDLAYLPHVESSFNLAAYSKYGAAGVWQFMRSTGRRFMKINYVIDERLDPMKATHAAAKLLGQNYKALESWPLAITAYNHGRTGMARARRRVGTSDIGVIVRKYKSRTFGFASRNFYAQFLAARSILRTYEHHLGPLKRHKPEVPDKVVLTHYIDVEDIETHLGVSKKTLREYNRDLRKPVFTSGKRIPKGYVLRLPPGTATPDPSGWLAKLPDSMRHEKQYRSNYYQVRRGDTLSTIARRNGTRVSTLVALNNLPSRHRIYPGQVIQLPDPGGRKAKAKAKAKPKPKPKPKAKPEPKPKVIAQVEEPPKPKQEPAPVPPSPAPEGAQIAQVEPGPQAVAVEPGPPITLTSAQLPTPDVDEAAETAATETVAPPGLVSQSDAVDPDEVGVATPDELAESDALATIAESVAKSAEREDPLIASVAPPTPAARAPGLPPSPDENSPWRRIDNNRVRVDSLETLGHYADWLEIPTQRLRNLNGLRHGRPIRMGQKLKLDFRRVGPETFLMRRMEYHKGIEEDFFGAYSVTGTIEHELKAGQSLWQLAHKRYGVPTWLIQRYNPDLDLSRLKPGTTLQIPSVEARN